MENNKIRIAIDGPEGTVGDGVLFPGPLAHAVVEDPLVVVDPLGLEDHVLLAQRLAGDGFVDVKVVLHVLRNFGGFDAFVPDAVVFGLHVGPRELADPDKGEPEAEVGEVKEVQGKKISQT